MMYKAKCAAVNAENPCVQLWNLDNMWGLFKVALWNALDPLTCFLVSLKCVYLGTTLLTKYDHKFPRRNKEIRFVFIISTLVRSMIYQIDSIKPAYKLSPLVWYITREKKKVLKIKRKKKFDVFGLNERKRWRLLFISCVFGLKEKKDEGFLFLHFFASFIDKFISFEGIFSRGYRVVKWASWVWFMFKLNSNSLNLTRDLSLILFEYIQTV